MMFLLQLKTVLRMLILPPSGSLLIALVGLLLLKRRPLAARIFLVFGIGSLWALSTPSVADLLSGAVESYPALDLRRPTGAQAIVILGGGGQRAFAPEYGGPAAEPLLLERLSYGAYVAQKTGLPVLVTGFHVEAHVMDATLARNFAVKARWVDDQSYDTFENAAHSVRILAADGIHRIILVTHASHLPRSVREFTAAGADVVPAPVGVLTVRDTGIYRYLPNPMALVRSFGAVYELLGEPVREVLAATHLRRQ
jgi:uncharacterized SAM-binding protein YcdF (DUF218 family)